MTAYAGQSAITPVHAATRADVAKAKMLMRHGLSMTEAADALDVLALDLDRQLMKWLGRSPDLMIAPEHRP